MIRETRTERAGDALPLNRIEALSDGMFAIIMTLLVIEIKPPEVHDAAQVAEALRHSLVALLPKIVAYAISFLTLAIFWVSHHQHFHALQHADRGVLWLNNLLLLFLAFVPFPTAVLGEYPTQPLAVALYGAALGLCALTMALLRRYTLAAGLHREVPEAALRTALIKSAAGPALYLLGAGVGWFFPPAGIALYAAIALFYFLPVPARNPR